MFVDRLLVVNFLVVKKFDIDIKVVVKDDKVRKKFFIDCNVLFFEIVV